jgi:hypothetical protein
MTGGYGGRGVGEGGRQEELAREGWKAKWSNSWFAFCLGLHGIKASCGWRARAREKSRGSAERSKGWRVRARACASMCVEAELCYRGQRGGSRPFEGICERWPVVATVCAAHAARKPTHARTHPSIHINAIIHAILSGTTRVCLPCGWAANPIYEADLPRLSIS